jgi:hypothetical protein
MRVGEFLPLTTSLLQYHGHSECHAEINTSVCGFLLLPHDTMNGHMVYVYHEQSYVCRECVYEYD